MIIQKVGNKQDAIKCNELLTKLIINEGIYDKNLKKSYKVKEYFEKIYKNKNNVLFIVKDDNNTAIGYAYCKIITNDNGPHIYHIAALDGLFVEEKYRNQGIATKLIEECKKWSKKIGAKILELNVIARNENAIKLYNKIGFDEFEKKMRFEL